MNNNYKTQRLVKILLLVSFLIVIGSIYTIITSIITSQTTGTLKASSPGATLTLIKPNYQSINIGISRAAIRLAPGNYQLAATNNGQQSIVKVLIIERQVTTESVVINGPSSQTNKLQLANDFIKELPLIGPASEFEINYEYKFTSSVAEPIIIISALTPQYQQAALAWIRSLGYNPSDFTIIYQTQNITNTNYTNGM